MYMKTFIIMLKNVLKKDYPDIVLGFCFEKIKICSHGP